MPPLRFNLKIHNETYAKLGWSHRKDCLCQRPDIQKKEQQKLTFIPQEFQMPHEDFGAEKEMKNINE